MKYGKLEDISGVNFSLPEDHPHTHRALDGEPCQTDFRLGGTMWNVPAWVGSWYPLRTPSSQFLFHFSRMFSAIELNATHYRIPTVETVKAWVDQVPPNFMFCPKFPQGISHYRRFQNCDQQTDEFLKALLAFGHHLGPSFIQLPPNFSIKSAHALLDYLRELPRDLHVAIEFRHPEWFAATREALEVWETLHELQITAVLSDTAGRRDAVHMHLTSPHFILRYGGNGMDVTDHSRLAVWAQRATEWSSRGLRSFHLWMHQPDSLVSPESCILFADELERFSGRTIERPQRRAADLFG